MPRSWAIGSARIAGRETPEAQATASVVPSARITGSWRPFMPRALFVAAFASLSHLHAVRDDRQGGRALSYPAIARHNGSMELAPRLELMNWLVSQGLTGLPEN